MYRNSSRVSPGGTVELLFSEVAGYKLYGPNDLAFGPRNAKVECGSLAAVRFIKVLNPIAILADSVGSVVDRAVVHHQNLHLLRREIWCRWLWKRSIVAGFFQSREFI